MQSTKVKDLMVPIAEYATVSEAATLGEAVIALNEAQKRVDRNREKHRAVLVLNEQGRVVGKLDQWTVLWAIEPRYKSIGNLKETSRYGFSPEFLKSMLESSGLWRKPLDDLCMNAAKMNVKEIMQNPAETEFIAEDASLNEAIHRMVMGRYQSLIVTRGDSFVGILRQSDVFKEVCDRINACGR